MQDITAPSVNIALVEDADQKTYNSKNVYDSTAEFNLAIEDLGKTSGISAVEVTLKNNKGTVLQTYTAETSSIWTSTEDIKEINELNATANPTEKQIL